jgi:hypothetical protein
MWNPSHQALAQNGNDSHVGIVTGVTSTQITYLSQNDVAGNRPTNKGYNTIAVSGTTWRLGGRDNNYTSFQWLHLPSRAHSAELRGDPCGGITAAKIAASLGGPSWGTGAGIGITSGVLSKLNREAPVTDLHPSDSMTAASSCLWDNLRNPNGIYLNTTIWDRPLTKQQVTDAQVFGFSVGCTVAPLNLGTWSVYSACPNAFDDDTNIFVVNGKMSFWLATVYPYSEAKILPLAKLLERNLA